MWPLDVLHDPAWQPLTWTLLHFLWQGLIVASVWIVLFRLSRAYTTQFRYLLGLFGMFVMAACPVATFVFLESRMGLDEARLSVAPAVVQALPDMPKAVPLPATNLGEVEDLPAVGLEASPRSPDPVQWIADAQPYLLSGWIIGLVFFSGRLLFGVVGAHRLGRGRLAVSDEIAKRAAALAVRLGFRSVPRVFSSRAACEAVVTGLLRPIVLLPVAWLTEMTPEVLEAVIAHELAHIRRFDLWFNLFQRFVETLLFYHPAVWWLSRRVRLAREMCCDELAAKATGERVVYVTALELVARKRLEPTKSLLEVALGITRMTLLDRVRNVLGLAARHEQGRWWPAAVLTLLVPPAIWLASMAAVTSAEEKTPAAAEPVATEGRTDQLVLNMNRDGNLSTTQPIRDIDEFLATQVKAALLTHHMTPADLKAGRELPTTVLIYVDSGTPYEKVEQVIRPCQNHGFRRFAFHTKKVDELFGGSAGARPQYKATALLRVAMQENPAAGGAAIETDRSRFDIYRNTQAQLLQSRFVLRTALRNPKVAKLPSIQRHKAAGDVESWLSQQLHVDFPGDAEIMRVVFSGNNPKEAATLANAIVDAYFAEIVNGEQERKRRRFDELERICEEKEQQMRNKREEFKGLTAAAGGSDPEMLSMRQRLILEEIALYRGESARAAVELRRCNEDLAVQKAGLEDAKGDARVPILKEIKRLEVIIKVIAEQQSLTIKKIEKLSQEVRSFGASSVDMDMVRAQIKNMDRVLSNFVNEREKLFVEIRTPPRVTLLERAE